MISLAPLYGGGALLIRETARRLKLGWPAIVLLGLAYAIVEEALVTQSLFNPNYLGLRLLDYGYISGLGIGAWWTVFVLAIHTIWSTAVPIALVESVSAGDRHAPWLGRVGLVITALLFALGCLMSYTFGKQQDDFAASTGQIVASCVVVLLLVVAADRHQPDPVGGVRKSKGCAERADSLGVDAPPQLPLFDPRQHASFSSRRLHGFGYGRGLDLGQHAARALVQEERLVRPASVGRRGRIAVDVRLVRLLAGSIDR